MKQIIPFAFLCSLIFIACGERSVGTAKVNQAPVAPNAAPAKGVASPVSPLASPAQTATSTATAVANLNPAHGQPGHRCDIAVGAPLPAVGTAPAVGVSPLANPAPVATPTTTPVTAPASTAGLNPAHGQPGHRCDIPVGSPLNSKPAS